MTNKAWDAKSYSENSQLQYLASKKFFETLTLNGSEIILDIGCGTGVITSEIAKKVPLGKVIGIDSSDSMISYAKEHYNAQNLEFKLMGAEELNFQYKFDVIISSFCIHWVNNKQELFNKIAKHLKESGETRLIMPFRHEEIAKIRCKLMNEKKWSSFFDSNTIKDLLIFDNAYDTYARIAGFGNLVFEMEEVTTFFENPSKLKMFLQNITSHLNKLGLMLGCLSVVLVWILQLIKIHL